MTVGRAPRAILIAGPTASGKSALAIALARALGGTVINADSQQVYNEWRVLSARPSVDEEALAPHRLFGHVAMDAPYSVGHWLAEVAPLLTLPWPIIVGGTGLYFKALTQGLAPIPAVPDGVRAAGEELLATLGLEKFTEELAARDPVTAAMVDLANPRRVLRAWEILEGTGEGLAVWKARTPALLLAPEDVCTVALTPDRELLYARCDARFDAMIAEGALDEVRAVMAMKLPPGAPGLMAVGAEPLMAHLRGETTLAAAAEKSKMETRRYAKRQFTWIRNQMATWTHLVAPDTEMVLKMVEQQ